MDRLISNQCLALKFWKTMNIFALNEDPELSASYLCDKHVVKMLTESCQILADTCDPKDLILYAPPKENGQQRTLYKPNNPCPRWVRASVNNKHWMVLHARQLMREYRKRYNNPDGFKQVIPFLDWVEDLGNRTTPTSFVEVIPEAAFCRKHPNYFSSNIHERYQLFYLIDKIFAKWKQTPPAWYRKGRTDEMVINLRHDKMKTIE